MTSECLADRSINTRVDGLLQVVENVCERVLKSIGRGLPANKGVTEWWESERKLDSYRKGDE